MGEFGGDNLDSESKQWSAPTLSVLPAGVQKYEDNFFNDVVDVKRLVGRKDAMSRSSLASASKKIVSKTPFDPTAPDSYESTMNPQRSTEEPAGPS